MGAPMAANILAGGHPLTVWNRSAQKMTPLINAGAIAAESPRALAESCDIIFTMVTDGPQVREVVLGAEGIIHGARPGTLLIDCSSIQPEATREIGALLAEKGIGMLDAPVSGGPEGATNGKLSIMVGGTADDYARALPLLQLLGTTVTHVGPAGAGQLVKLCNQIACSINILAMSEALALAKAGGLDLAMVRTVLLGGAAQSWMLQNWGPKIVNDDFTPGFTVSNAQKDLRNVQQAAQALTLPLPGTAMAQQLWRANEAAGEAEDSNVSMYKSILRMANLQEK